MCMARAWHACTQVRVADFHRASRFLGLFEDEGCRMVKMSCEEHDALAAGSQVSACLMT